MKGRNSSVVSVRVSDDVYQKMKTQADGMSVGEFFKHFIQTWFGYKNASVLNIRITEKAYKELEIQANGSGNGLPPGEFLENFVNAWFANKLWEKYKHVDNL